MVRRFARPHGPEPYSGPDRPTGARQFWGREFFDGIGELRIPHGPGYRVYFLRWGQEVVLLLIGGDKSSQRRDIAQAKRLAREVKDDGGNDPAV